MLIDFSFSCASACKEIVHKNLVSFGKNLSTVLQVDLLLPLAGSFLSWPGMLTMRMLQPIF